MSSKLINKAVKMRNGNRSSRSVIKIYHWNMGNKLWQSKHEEIESLILDNDPDLFFVSEANLMCMLPDYERNIGGYDLHLPITLEKHSYARIVLLVKQVLKLKYTRK